VGPSGQCHTSLVEKEKLKSYQVTIRPTEIGKHQLSITYDEVHIKGSPFAVQISAPADPAKVRLYGPGVEHGILSKFKSNFVVETKGAGGGHLSVRVRGPKSGFHVDMQRDPRHDRTIHCKYEPKEPGDYQIEVKWAGQHVPNSPVLVMIFDTEAELERFQRGQLPSNMPPSPFLPPGFMPPRMPPPGMGPPPPPLGQYGPPSGNQRGPAPGMMYGPPKAQNGTYRPASGQGRPTPQANYSSSTARSSRSQTRQASILTAGGGHANGY
jgi:hypothetical protein